MCCLLLKDFTNASFFVSHNYCLTTYSIHLEGQRSNSFDISEDILPDIDEEDEEEEGGEGGGRAGECHCVRTVGAFVLLLILECVTWGKNGIVGFNFICIQPATVYISTYSHPHFILRFTTQPTTQAPWPLCGTCSAAARSTSAWWRRWCSTAARKTSCSCSRERPGPSKCNNVVFTEACGLRCHCVYLVCELSYHVLFVDF